jgi:hypothetical protein
MVLSFAFGIIIGMLLEFAHCFVIKEQVRI